MVQYLFHFIIVPFQFWLWPCDLWSQFSFVTFLLVLGLMFHSGILHGTTRLLHVQLYSEFTSHYTCSLILNLVPVTVLSVDTSLCHWHMDPCLNYRTLKTQCFVPLVLLYLWFFQDVHIVSYDMTWHVTVFISIGRLWSTLLLIPPNDTMIVFSRYTLIHRYGWSDNSTALPSSSWPTWRLEINRKKNLEFYKVSWK